MEQNTFLFDFDGTLADSMSAVLKIMDVVIEQYGLKMDKEAVVDKLRNNGVREVLKEFKIPFYRVPRLIKKYREEYKKEAGSIRPIKGIASTINKLREAGIKMGIITTNSKDSVGEFLRINQLDVFDYIRADVGIFGKSREIKRIIKSNKLDPASTFFIGDETRDITAARNTGVKSIAVTWGFQTGISLRKENPDYILNSPEELLDVVKNKN